MKKAKMMRGKVLVKLDQTALSAGGLHIVESAQENANLATVITVGKPIVTGKGKLIPCEVQKGDRVLVSKYAGSSDQFVNVFGDETSVMQFDEILAKVG